MNKIKAIIVSLGLVLGFIGAVMLPQNAMATAVQDPMSEACKGNSNLEICKQTDMMTIIKNVINTLMFCIGIVAVGMIIFSGVKYATSMGDAGNITKAKNTLLYSVVGLVVTFLAYAIVNFVVLRLLK
jgi:heme/copper-type cytochrome/quinol oxidase subunit 2